MPYIDEIFPGSLKEQHVDHKNRNAKINLIRKTTTGKFKATAKWFIREPSQLENPPQIIQNQKEAVKMSKVFYRDSYIGREIFLLDNGTT